MRGEEKGRPGWHREAASQQTPLLYRSDPIQATQGHRLPAYGRPILDAQRQGFNMPWLCIALAWDLGRAFPRVVVTNDIPALELDMRLVRGLGCMVAHRGETRRALDVAEAALMAGAESCPVFDVSLGRLTATTDEVKAIRGLKVAA